MASNNNNSTTQTSKFSSCLSPPIWTKLANSSRILLCGCGGGYDIMSCIPVFYALEKAGATCFLGNLTFTDPYKITSEKVTEICYKVTASDTRNDSKWSSEKESYWPEWHISRYFKEKEQRDVPVYMFNRTGVTLLAEAYEKIIQKENIDTVIVCDGGTDSLMFGNEPGLGTPQEDMTTIAAVSSLKSIKQKFLFCIGMGVDCFHGVVHDSFLENVATLQKQGGYLGSFSLTDSMAEAKKFKEIYLASLPINSIVSSSILSATEGHFGNYHGKTESRTRGSELYISPLMCQYWTFELDLVAKNVLYMNDEFYKTKTISQTNALISKWRHENHHLIRKKHNIPY